MISIKSKLIFKSIIFFFCIICFIHTAASMEVAITVDDLPEHGDLPPNTTRADIAKQMLSVLNKHHIQGVYGLVNGSRIHKASAVVLEEWVKQGQLLGNHTYSHLDLATSEVAPYQIDIKKNEPILTTLMGNKNYKYFRYPYLAEGNTEEKRNGIRNYLFSESYQLAPVTTDFFDYAWNNPYARCAAKNDFESIEWLKKTYHEQSLNALIISHELSMMLFGRDIKNILLLHIGAFDALMLDDLLTAYEKNGVKFISLKDALTDDVYQINPNIVSDRTYTFLNQIRLSRGLQNPPVVTKLYDSFPESKLDSLCK